MRFTVFFISLLAALCSLLIPFYQKEFINTLALQNKSGFSVTILYLLFMGFIVAIFAQIFTFFSKKISFLEGSYAQEWLSHRVYEKAMHLKTESQATTTVGHIISIYATDVLATSTILDEIFPNMMASILSIVLAPFVMIYLTNINPTGILIAIFFVLLFNSLMAIRQSKFFLRSKILSSIRMSFVNEWLQNMRVIRMLGWLPVVEARIKEARINETKNRLEQVTSGSFVNAISYSAPFFINILAVFLLLKLEGKNVTPGEIFSLLWIFAVLLTRPMRTLPMMLIMISDCKTSMKRLQNFLTLESEEPGNRVDFSLTKSGQNVPNVTPAIGLSIKIRNLNFQLENKKLLDSINIDIKAGEFIAIVGEVGSGKSLFLQALVRMISAQFDEYDIGEKAATSISLKELRSYFAYVPQESFIINSTLRDNVVFEYDSMQNKNKQDIYFNDNSIIKSLETAQFHLTENKKDVALKDNLDLEIGERGVNLSGGQKQRVALSRAHYADRSILLLDDCLSAVDVNTEERINKTLLNGAWQGKTRILVTHRLSILEHCDRVFTMHNGRIVERV